MIEGNLRQLLSVSAREKKTAPQDFFRDVCKDGFGLYHPSSTATAVSLLVGGVVTVTHS